MAGSELILSVSKLNEYANSVLTNDVRLRSIKVAGELSNFRLHGASGHMYFALKDESARISCVMFKSSAARLRLTPRDGMKVVVSGSVSIYPRDGQYQLYVTSMREEGEGELYRRFLELRDRLESEGLFARKRPLPLLPKCVGIVTSENGAALHDIITVARRRFPTMNFILAPASVQGDTAPKELISALELLNDSGIPDVIIIGRGGGSYEDLSCFNDEELARAIYNSRIPTVSAVGHEVDFTIADFAADMRAPTPSAAAELCVPELAQLMKSTDMLSQRLENLARSALRDAEQRVKLCINSPVFALPKSQLDARRRRLDAAYDSLCGLCKGSMQSAQTKLQTLRLRLHALSPNSILARGYAMVLNEEGSPVTRITKTSPGAKLDVIMTDGAAHVTVNGITSN